MSSSIKSGKAVWKEGGVYMRKGAKYLEANYGEVAAQIWAQVKSVFGVIWSVDFTSSILATSVFSGAMF